MPYVTFDTNACPWCGERVFLREHVEVLNEYRLRPDGTVIRASRNEKDKYVYLELVCPACGVVEAGYWSPEDDEKFEYLRL